MANQPLGVVCRSRRPGCVVLHILAFYTPDACLLACWKRWISHWLDAPTSSMDNVEYRLSMKMYSPPEPVIGKERWRHVINARVSFILHSLDALPLGAVVLFTDLDVVPFRPPSKLLPLPYDITFMREPPGHGGRTGRHIVNAGFFAMRNGKNIKQLIGHWRWILKGRPNLMDQDVANWLLLAKPSTKMYHNVSWGTWPRSIATGLLEDVAPETCAFHAIFAVSDDEKLIRLNEAFDRHPKAAATLPRCERAFGGASANIIATGESINGSKFCHLGPSRQPRPVSENTL